MPKLPLPPIELRRQVGPIDDASYDNPTGAPVYPHIADPAQYRSVFDFGCGCGRVARQMALMDTPPERYVGIDLSRPAIEWCQQNLEPEVPGFSFLHHDVHNVVFNPGSAKAPYLPFPVEDESATFVNAMSVFTHTVEPAATHYVQEARRILAPGGLIHCNWFVLDRREWAVMHLTHTNALYVDYQDPTQAVIFDREWIKATCNRAGLAIAEVRPPVTRGFQYLLILRRGEEAPQVEIPPDDAPLSDPAASWDDSA